jgi:hypothetical protein
MIADFSPFTRKLLAIGMLILALFGLSGLVVTPVYSLVSTSLSELADARFRLARVEALRTEPAMPPGDTVPPGLIVKAPDAAAAAAQVQAMLGATVARTQVQLVGSGTLPAGPTDTGQVLQTITVKGNHDAVLAFVNDIERTEPMLRFRTWSLTAEPSAAPGQPAMLNLDAVLVAAWSKAP